MTDPEAAFPSSTPGESDSPPTAPAVPSRAGEPAPPGSSEGRARAFRERETQRRSRRRELIGHALVVAIIILGIYAIVSARPFVPSSGPGPPTPGPPITVNLTRPAVGTVTCGNGGTAYTERIVWANASALVMTNDIDATVHEADTDIVSDIGVVPNVTLSSLCAGDPPSGGSVLFSWYVVMVAPNGTILLSYTISQGWVSVTGGTSTIPIENGTTMIVVTDVSIAGRGYLFWVAGASNGSSIFAQVVL